MEVAKVLGIVSSKSLAYPNRLKLRGLCTIVGWFKLDVYLKPLTLQEERGRERERERGGGGGGGVLSFYPRSTLSCSC